jgi:phosphoribosylglycinamide formyltransferase-1
VGRLKVGVLISGRGSNLQALLDACADPAFPAEIALVISNVAAAQGLERATKAGVPTRVFNHKEFPDRESFDAKMDEALRAAGIELVCLAGFMRLLSAGFVEGWHGKMINIHPSLLPAFKGLHTHAQALAAGVAEHGCTVHWVTPALDDGPVILQGRVPVLAGDTEETLAERVLETEHRIYPAALRLIAEGKV